MHPDEPRPRQSSPGRATRHMRGGLTVCAAGLLLLGFATPARLLWAQAGIGWWAPFLLWGAAIVALAAAAGCSDDGGRSAP